MRRRRRAARNSARRSRPRPRPPRHRRSAAPPLHVARLERAQRGQVAALRSAARVGLQRAAQVVVVEHGQVHRDRLGQRGLRLLTLSTSTRCAARPGGARRRRSRRPGRSARSRPPSSRRRRGRGGRRCSRVAVPRQTAPVRCGRNSASRCIQIGGDLAQRREFGRLGVGAEERDVGAHLVLDAVVARQLGRAAPPRAEQRARRGASPGRTPCRPRRPGGRRWRRSRRSRSGPCADSRESRDRSRCTISPSARPDARYGSSTAPCARRSSRRGRPRRPNRAASRSAWAPAASPPAAPPASVPSAPASTRK